MNAVKELKIQSYPDYRDYLLNFYRSRKAKDKSFSLTRIAQKLQQSKMSIKYLMDKKHHIADENINILAQALELVGPDKQYFSYLVRFNKAKDLSEKNQYFHKMMQISASSMDESALGYGELGYLRKWFYPVIAEMSYLRGFEADAKWIQCKLLPGVPEKEILEAVEYLQKEGYLRGGKRSQSKIKVPDDFQSHIYKTYVAQLIQTSRLALERSQQSEFESFNLTISVDEKRFELAKQLVADFRHKLHDVLANDESCSRVLQFNLQMFTAASVEKENL